MRALTTWKRHLPALALVAGVSAFAVGCESTSSEPQDGGEDPATQTEDIDARYGGFNTSDEVAGFADPYLLEEGSRPVDDEMEMDPAVQDLRARPDVSAYAVRLTFGYLERDSSHVNTPTDWSGSAVVDTGAVLARRTILFEPLQGDHVVRPRPNRRTIEWEATTTVHFDGLQLVVLDPTGEDGDGALTIDMPLFSETIAMSELVELDRTVEVDDAGHQVRLQARKLVRPDDPQFCRRGWLAGRWQHLVMDGVTDAPVGVIGRFAGHFTNAEGTIAGALRGYYGINRRGHRVLFGKLIGENGKFEALMRGTWEHAPDSRGHGRFLARLYDADRNPIGATRGAWQRRNAGQGTFEGAWALLCADDSADDVVLDEEIFEPGE